MILDKGICTVYRKADKANGVGMPQWEYEYLHQSWYGELDFATAEHYTTEYREESKADARIRIHQDRRINNHCVVVMDAETSWRDGVEYYNVTRAYHGHDTDSGELITDLTLERVTP